MFPLYNTHNIIKLNNCTSTILTVKGAKVTGVEQIWLLVLNKEIYNIWMSIQQ